MSTLNLVKSNFSDNRAEWPASGFKDIFVMPSYIAKLQVRKPCFLIGGRGTGKTTSLLSLKYDATFDRLRTEGKEFSEQKDLGILVRMNKNRVRAFRGDSLGIDEWGKLFGHYINLIICIELCQLAVWLEGMGDAKLSFSTLALIAADLGVESAENLHSLESKLRIALSSLQLFINNPSPGKRPTLSMAESPLRIFACSMEKDGLLGGRVIFCCIDEYENLLDYQQAILNTYIKHAEPPLSYKIGMRKNGLRSRHTLDVNDLLRTPDDYDEIEIAHEGFDRFAVSVAEARLRLSRSQGAEIPIKIDEFLEDLSIAEEAELLGASRIASTARDELVKAGAEAAVVEFFKNMRDGKAYFLKYWSEASEVSLLALAAEWLRNQETWETRIGNYGFASLFWLSRGRKGARLRKYYCGRRAFLAMAAGNIRYFLELIELSISYADEEADASLKSPCFLSAKSQTLAAREVGRRRLAQLDGLADSGPQLKRVVLALGRVFFEWTRNPEGRLPEATSFVLTGSPESMQRSNELLSEGVSHLALEVEVKTKATSSLEIRDEEYRIHRIFSAFFEISQRKKRRKSIPAEALLEVLTDKPSAAIAEMLGNNAAQEGLDTPEQLAFFSKFYEGSI